MKIRVKNLQPQDQIVKILDNGWFVVDRPVENMKRRTSPARLAVQRGNCLLLKHFPYYFNHINLATLRMKHPDSCVLGQLSKTLYGSSEYCLICDKLGISGYKQQAKVGFEAPNLEKSEYIELNKEWARIIRRQRKSN